MQTLSTGRQIFGLFLWGALCLGVAALGALASIEASEFYAGLTKPDWAPPGWLFGPVWSTLFAMMAVSAWLVWRQGGFAANKTALGFFLGQLAFNALWSWLFFAWHLGGPALADIGAMWLLIAATIVTFWRTSKLAGLLLVPYLVWVSFAAALNYSVWQLNPVALGG